MKKNNSLITASEDLLVDLTCHKVPVSLLEEFAAKIVYPYFRGNLNAAMQTLIQKAIDEQDFILSHVTHVRAASEA